MLQTARVAPLLDGEQVVGTITTIEDVTQREHQNLLLRRHAERQELVSWALAYLLRSSDPETLIKQIFPRVAAQMDVDTYFIYTREDDGNEFHLHSAGGVSPALKAQVSSCRGGNSPCEATNDGGEVFVLSNIQERNDQKAAFAKKLGLQAYICLPLKADAKILGTLSFGSHVRKCFDAEDIEFTGVLSQYVAIAIDRSRTLKALNKAQSELTRHAESLETKVRERTARLQETVNELETFSYSLAHDIRAPLRHIRGYAEMLVDDYGTALEGDGVTYINLIIRSIQRLDDLTKDMLAYNRVSRESINLYPVDLDVLVKKVVTSNPVMSEHGVVDIQSLPRVLGERILLEQIFTNLLDNALKFVPEGVVPHIIVRSESVQADRADQDWVRIFVEDNGIGIAPEYHSKIFRIFERLTGTQPGTGIGLAIVAKAVTKMGGRLGVESQLNMGSRFWLELRRARQVEA
jgi:signal transduction histidine kinase